MDLNISKSISERVILLDNIPPDFSAAGAKARTLGRLIQAGFPVPPGFCIILDEEAFIAADDAAARGSKSSTPDLPQDLRQAISEAYRQLRGQGAGAVSVAVRSSAAREDGSEQTFAGQFESILNIDEEAALFRAIRSSWESARQRQVKGSGQPAEPFVYAVIVQEMVNPVIAGVVFSIHPLTGNRNQLIVEAVPGLGDRLMSGQQEPTRLVFDKSELNPVEHHYGKDFPDSGREKSFWQPILKMALQIETLLGQAADIEFAYDGNRFWILQARPVTRAAGSVPASGERSGRMLTRANIGEIMPEVVTPLTWTTFLRTLELEENPARPVRPSRMAVLYQGLAHIDLQMLWNSYQSLWGIPAEVILTGGIGCNLNGIENQLRAHPQRESLGSILLKNMYVWAGLLAPGWFERRLLRHFDAVRHSFEAWRNAVSSQPEWLADGLQNLLSITARAFLVHQQTTFLGMCAYGALAARRSPSRRAAAIDELLAHHPPQTRHSDWEVNIRMLADRIKQTPELLEIFRENETAVLQQKLLAHPSGRKFWKELEQVVQTAGDRAFNEFELASPRWSEDPTVVLDILRSLLFRRAGEISSGDETTSTAPSQPQNGSNAPGVTGWFHRRLYRAFVVYRGWREKSKHLLMQCFGQLRRIYLQIGRVLVEQHILNTPDEIFFLHLTEIEQLLRGKIPWKLHEQLRLRMDTHKSLKEAHSRVILQISSHPEDERLSGIPVSGGTITGPVKVMRSPETPLHPGEVIVATTTDPGWAPLFSVCGGIVTEIGGMLSHTAILAREMNKPAVFGVRDITAKVRDGQPITVDGNNGEVVIHAGEESS